MEFENINTPEELLENMHKNIIYGFVCKNAKVYTDAFSEESKKDWYNQCIIQDGKKVLETKVGTCWDQVELERLWFKEKNYEFKTIFLWFELNKKNDLPTHTFLMYKSDNKYYLFEHAYEHNRGIHEFDSFEEIIEGAKQKQLEYVISNYKVKEDFYDFIKVCEYFEPLPNLSVEEYLKHVKKEVM